jgi:eukaryotic-like serine/threonine-protein kinase
MPGNRASWPARNPRARPFWSPDGEWIAYFRAEALLKVPADGGPVVRVATLPAVQAPLGANSGVWRRDGTIIVSLAVGPLLRVPAGGGEVATFADLPRDVALNLRHLSLLPDDSLLVGVNRAGGMHAIGVLDDGQLRVVLDASDVSHPRYAPSGHIIFVRRQPTAGLWAVRFAADRRETVGEPFLIGSGEEPSVARDGTLAFIAEPQNPTRQLAWFSLDGVPGAPVAEPREWIEGLSISPDGTRLLASAVDGVWEYDVRTGVRSRITRGSTDITPQWVAGNRIVFVRTEGADPVLVLKRLGATGDERVLARGARFPRATANGQRVVFNQRRTAGAREPWEVAWIDLDTPDVVHTLPELHAGARFGTVSPDGTLVAYISGEMGHDEVFLTRLPSGEGKWQLSNAGGGWTLFSPRGDAVFYRALDNSFMSVPIVNGADVTIGPPRRLFGWGGDWLPFYDIARDGTRGVAAMPVDRRTRVPSLSVVRHWQREFPQPVTGRRRAGACGQTQASEGGCG